MKSKEITKYQYQNFLKKKIKGKLFAITPQENLMYFKRKSKKKNQQWIKC